MKPMRLSLMRGDSWETEFTIRDLSGNAVDITGSVFRFTAKSDPADLDGAAILSATSANGKCVITSAATGKMEVRLTPTDTDALAAPADLWFDLQIRDAALKVWTPAYGKLQVIEDISRTAP